MKRGYFSLNPFINYQIIENSDYTVPSSGWESTRNRSYIVVGGDIIIKGSVFENADHPVALIALKNASGSGGNIYIEGDLGGAIPDAINASLVAEGSVVSGTKDVITGVASSYIDTSILNIPINQLYVKGIIASRNTIGGAAREVPICPVSLPLCSEEIARKYDFNYFRNFVSGDETFNFTHRAYTRSTDMDTYSFIIEYEPRMLSDPPPGLDF